MSGRGPALPNPFLPPGSYVDPSHVLAIWVEPETLDRIGVGALPLDAWEFVRERVAPPGLGTDGPVPARFDPEPGVLANGLAPILTGFPSGSADVPASYLFRLVAFMESECDVIRVETKGAGADAPIRLTGFRDNVSGDLGTFDETKPIVIAAIAPRARPDAPPHDAPTKTTGAPVIGQGDDPVPAGEPAR